MTLVLAFGAAAVVTWLLRVLTITIVPAHVLPRRLRQALPHVGPAVLAAVITAALVSAPADQRTAFLVGAAVTALVARIVGTLTALVTGLAVVALLGLV